MAIVTADDYRERLYRMRKNIYMGGELIGRDDPRLKPGVDLIADSFERVKDPNLKDTITAKSHLTGEEVHRLNHIHQSSEDLLKKQECTRLLCQQAGGLYSALHGHRCLECALGGDQRLRR